ncbi:MAG: lysophospholipid acyltransferase family protein [Cyanobacteriota bacterium]|nr:lysophospholipid acyltransferase family protein [Cyanobacteriota bacterium]
MNRDRNREPFESLVLYHLLKWSFVSPVLHLYFQGRIYGGQNVPLDRPFVVASNHASIFDPPIVSCAVKRPVSFMAKEELFNIPGFKQAIELYGAYPVKRTASDRNAIRAAIKSLEEGWATGVFLQGTRTSDGRITSPKLGAAMIAAKAGVPILPVSLWGTEGVLQKGSAIPRPVPITVRLGKLVDAPSSTRREELESVTQKCADAINAMHALGR